MDTKPIQNTWKSVITCLWQDTYNQLKPLFDANGLANARKIELYSPYVIISKIKSQAMGSDAGLLFTSLNKTSTQELLIESPWKVNNIHYLTISFEYVYNRKQIALKLYIPAKVTSQHIEAPSTYFYKKVQNGAILKQLVATNKLDKIDSLMQSLLKYGHQFYHLHCKVLT